MGDGVIGAGVTGANVTGANVGASPLQGPLWVSRTQEKQLRAKRSWPI